MTTVSNWHIIQSNLIEGVTDPKEVAQSMIAWNYLATKEELTFSTIMQTHNLIMTNLMPARLGGRGSLRIYNVTVGGRLCPHWHNVPENLDVWIVQMKNWKHLDPKTMHILFEYIHPFADGNGRTGRLLMWWHEIKLGLDPTLIKYVEREDYYSWF